VASPRDPDETITLATVVLADDGSLVIHPPADDDETIAPTLDLRWMNAGTVLRDGDTRAPSDTIPDAPPSDGARQTRRDTDSARDTSPARPAANAKATDEGTRVDDGEARVDADGTRVDDGAGDDDAAAQLDAATRPPTTPRPDPPAAADTPEARDAERFELLGEVGKGAMGEVLLVRDRGLWRRVAFKRLLPELAENRAVVSRFFSEAQVTAQLDHPNIVPIYELDASTGRGLGYTMKLVRGETLTKVIARDRELLEREGRRAEPRRLARRLALFLDVCDAIAYAHAKRVLHRDLKPDNIMVGDLGEVYVMDWGIFRLIGDGAVDTDAADDGDAAVTTTGSHGRTQFGAIIGTPSWMSPEQAAGRIPDLGPASDQYALGLILFALVTLRPPRPRDALEVTLRRAREGELAPIAHEHGGGRIPRELKAIIRRATAVDPEARYPDVEALADDVRAYLRGDAVTTEKDTPLQAFARLLSKHKFWAVAAVMVLFVAGAATAAVMRIRADAHQESIEHFLQSVDRRVADAEETLRGFEVGAVRLAGRVGVAVAAAPPDPPPAAHQSADFDAGRVPGLVASPCWVDLKADGEPARISLTDPVIKLSEGALPDRARTTMQRLAAQRPALDELLRRPADPGAAPADDARVEACATPVRRTFATLAVPGLAAGDRSPRGVHASFPGVGGYCASYDGLTRPKYRAVRSAADAVAWGRSVYPDRYGAGLLTSVSAPVLDPQGAQIGVAGLELTLSWLVERLLVQDDAAHIREAFLVTRDGRVIARQAGFDAAALERLTRDFDPCEEDRGRTPEAPHEAESDLPELPIEAVRALIVDEGRSDGQTRADLDGEEVFAVFRRIPATGWYYVAAADESELP